jgi:hypothetical protein
LPIESGDTETKRCDSRLSVAGLADQGVGCLEFLHFSGGSGVNHSLIRDFEGAWGKQ